MSEILKRELERKLSQVQMGRVNWEVTKKIQQEPKY